MFTTYHLKFWSKSCTGGLNARVYVNAEDRSTLGYFERRTAVSERQPGTPYDDHRIAKGDNREYSDTYSNNLPAAAVTSIFTAPSIAGLIAAAKIDDDYSRFQALLEHARGFEIIPFRGCTAAEKRAMKARKQFTIEL